MNEASQVYQLKKKQNTKKKDVKRQNVNTKLKKKKLIFQPSQLFYFATLISNILRERNC